MNKIILSILPLILLYLVTSCSQEEAISPSGGNGENGDKQVPINITFPGSSVHTQTRSGGTEIGSDAENLITALYVDLKFGSTLLRDTIKGDQLLDLLAANKPDDKGNPVIKISFTVDYSVWIGSDEVDVTVFANNGTAPTPISRESDLWQPAPTDETDTNKKALFMSGYFPKMNKILGDTIKLTRQVAKLRVKVGKTEDCLPQNLKILYNEMTVEVLHVADRSAALSGDPITNVGYIDYVARTALNNIPGDVEESILIADSCYIHENNADELLDGQTTTIKVKIPTFDPLTNHKETIEREIKINDTKGNKIERNHIYTLDIKIRAQNEPLEIFFSVKPWTVQVEDFPGLEPVPTIN